MPISWRLIAFCCALISASTSAQIVPVTRIPTQSLHMTSPGVAVIRDSTEWTTLWRRFDERQGSGINALDAQVPAVDFGKSILVAVSYGGFSGCGNSASYIRRIIERSDSLIVMIGPRTRSRMPTCMMYVQPVDVARIDRTTKPVAFRSGDADVGAPPPAVWLSRPTLQQFDAMPSTLREAMLEALVRDTTTPVALIRTFASRPQLKDRLNHGDLMRRPDVRSDLALLEFVSGAGGGDLAREADSLLFARFGPAVARDSSTPVHILENLIESFTRNWTPRKEMLALTMLKNERVVRDRELLHRLRFSIGSHPTLVREVCRVFFTTHRPSGDGADNPLQCPELTPTTKH